MKKQRKTRVLVTRYVYDNVRFAVNVDKLDQKIAAKAYGISQPTVSKIANSKNFKQYKAACKADYRKDKTYVIPSGGGSYTYVHNECLNNLQIVKEIESLLKKIV